MPFDAIHVICVQRAFILNILNCIVQLLRQQYIINVTGCKSKAERGNVGGYERTTHEKGEKEGKVNQEEREYLFDV